MTPTTSVDLFNKPPEGSFLLMPNGTPAAVGPWAISIRSDRRLATRVPHLVGIIVNELPAGSWHMTISWTYRLADGSSLGQIRQTSRSTVLPRPRNGAHTGGTLANVVQVDAGAVTISRRGKRRITGVTYHLEVRHLYAPGAEMTMERITEQHQALRKTVDDALSSAENRLASIRNDLAGVRSRVTKLNDI
jgi:hypothetical protein